MKTLRELFEKLPFGRRKKIEERVVELTSEERMRIAAEMSKL